VQFDGDCWEKHGRLFPERKANLLSNFGNNLCQQCIEPYLIPKSDSDAEN
jgi:dihydroneopterin aldolase